MKELKELRRNYENTPIPEELDTIIQQAFQNKKNKKPNQFVKWGFGAVAAITLFIGGLNVSPAMANHLSTIPIVGDIVKVLTFTYKVDEGTYQANIDVPTIEGLENKELEHWLNDKYLEESKQLFTEFNEEIEMLKKEGGGHLGIDSGFEVKTNNEQILSIGRYVVNTVGSSSTTVKYDNVDKQNQLLITLPSLFKDEQYVDIISENIIAQMTKQMELDSEKVFFMNEDNFGGVDFEKIDKNQNFYITDEGKLVICFDKYEVAPGYMGLIEFEIPTEVLADILVSQGYIR